MARQRKSNEPKFIHHINGKEAEQLLKSKGLHSSFLVRTSNTDPDDYALSYRKINEVCHIKFKTTEEGFKADGIPDEYPTINDLITHVQLVVKDLDYPMWPSDPAPEGLPPRMFFGRLTSKHAQRLLLDENAQQERNFLIRSATTCYDQLAFSVRLVESNEIMHLLIHHEEGKYFMKGSESSTKFESFKKLLDHYLNPGNRAVQHANGESIQLIKPMICPWNEDHSMAKKQKLTEKTDASEEFEELQSQQSKANPPKSTIGRKPENVSKNRYKNILPYDDTRVVLKSGQDYINANYLEADPRLGTYIGCQGPLSSTIADFWQMVWQEDSQFIVMLTNTVEGGKNKCAQYWPKDVGKEIMLEQFRIKAQETVLNTSDYVITKLILENEGKQKTVNHCHYTGWPDKSIPKNVEALIKFSQEILRLRSNVATGNSGPIVAHCSAGIGRTGTYILISLIIDHMQKFGNSPEIFNFAKTLRGQRPGMVQTLQQYELVYKATEIFKKKYHDVNTPTYGNLPEGDTGVYGNIGQP